jgi:two-component system sensor histidine kinase KdpD
LPTEELLKRLASGEVYVPEKAKIAAIKFFSQANLHALREIALRYTAHRVDDDMLLYKQEHGIKEVIPAGSRLLACVSSNSSSADIIRTTHRFAGELDSEWFAVYVDSPQERVLKPEDIIQLDKNLNLARELGANIVKLSGNSIANELIMFAQSKNVTLIVIGFSRRSKFEELIKGSIINEIAHNSTPIQVLVVQGTFENRPRRSQRKKKTHGFNITTLMISMVNLILTTGLCLLLRPVLEVHDIMLLFVVPIVLTGMFSGFIGGILASILAVACFNFFFIPPFHTFVVHDIRFILTFGVLFFVGTVTSFLADLVKRQSEKAKQREKFIQTLYEFSRKLLSTYDLNTRLESIVKNVSELFETETAVLLPKNGRLTVSIKSNAESILGEHELGIAQWSFENKKRAGFGTKTLVSSQWQYLPLTVQNEIIGILAIKPYDPQAILAYEKQHLLESFTNIVALSLESFYETGT